MSRDFTELGNSNVKEEKWNITEYAYTPILFLLKPFSTYQLCTSLYVKEKIK